MKDETVPARFRTQVARHGSSAAVLTGRASVTYQQLGHLVSQMTNALLARPASQAPVALMAEDPIPTIAAILSILSAGRPYMPIDPRLPAERRRLVFRESGADLVLCDRDSLQKAHELTVAPLLLEESDGESIEPPLSVLPEDVATIMYTSGTSGVPKGVYKDHRSVLAHVRNHTRAAGFASGDRISVLTPLSSAVTLSNLFGALLNGATACPLDVRDATSADVIEWMECLGVTVYYSVPTLFRRVADAKDRTLPDLRLVRLGGELVLRSDYELFRSRFEPTCRFNVSYGSAETINLCQFSVEEGARFEGDVVPVGYPHQDVEIFLDEEEIVVRSPYLALGYWKQPELTARAFSRDADGKRVYRTGDRGRLLPDGCLVHLGRKDTSVAKIRGLKVDLSAVRSRLLEQAGVKDAAAVAVANSAGDVELVAYVAGREDAGLRAAFVDLPAVMTPSRFVFLEQLPTLPNGKLDSRALPAVPLLELPEPVDVPGILAAVLGVSAVGPDDNFFALGGDSLKAMDLAARLSRLWGARVPPTLVRQAPTVTALLAARPGQPDAALPLAEGDAMALTAAQESFWFLHQAQPQLYQYGHRIEIRGPLQRDVLQRALRGLLERHDGLRTRLAMRDGRLHVSLGPAEFPLPDLEGSEGDFLAAPMDLSLQPQLQGRLSTEPEGRHVLFLKSYHAATDYASWTLLLQELGALYEDRPLPAAGSHQQYARSSEAWMRGPAAAAQEEHWRRKLAGLPRLAVASGFRCSYEGGVVRRALPRGAFDGPRRLARERGCTFFAVCLTALFGLFHRRTGQTDFAIGMPASLRWPGEHDRLVGCLFNTVAVRAQPRPEQRWSELLDEVARLTWEALAHAELPFSRVVRAVAPERVAVGNPLVQVLLNVVDPRCWPDRWGECEIQVDGVRAPFSVLDASFRVTGEGAELEYSADLFTAAEASRLLDEYLECLSELSGDCQRRLFEPVFAALSRHDAKAIAVQSVDGCLTYAELDRRSDNLAGRLLRSRLEPEQVVGLWLERSLELPLAILAVMKAGGTFLMLDPNLPPLRLQAMLEDSRASMVVKRRGQFIDFSGPTLDVEEDEEGVWTPPPVRPGQLAYLMFTSGSTGRAKAVCLTHGNLAHFFRAISSVAPLSRPRRFVMTTSSSFDISLLEILFPLWSGGCTFAPSYGSLFQLGELRAALDRSEYDVLQLTPSVWQLLLNSGYRPPPGRVALTGGEPLGPELAARLCESFEEVWNLYGPTEVTIWATAHEVRPTPVAGPGSNIGRCLPGVYACILDENLQPVAPETAGELYLGGPQVARGYLDRPEQTEWAFRNSLYRTGDRAAWLADGALRYLGRNDSQLKIRGVRIEPREVEHVLRDITGGWATVVASRDGQSLVAYLAASPTPVAAVRRAAAERLSGPMLPAEFVVVQDIPLNANGKLDRAALPDPVDERVLRLWRACLGRAELKPDEDFFLSGGHSLLAADLLARVQAEFGNAPSLGAFMEAPTAGRMAAWLRDPVVHPWPSVVPLHVAPEERIRFYCVHPEGGGVLLYRKLAKSLGPHVSFYGVAARQGGLTGIVAQAASYVEDLLRFDPEGPYYLGGLSLGGPVAYEMGVELARRGRAVPLVALFDSYVPTGQGRRPRVTGWRRTRESADRLVYHAETLLWHCRGWRERVEYLRDKLGFWRARGSRLDLPRTGRDERYTPSASEVPVVMFCASHRRAGADDPAQRWRDAGLRVTMRQLRGYHGTDLVTVDPLLRVLARELRAELEGRMGG